MRSPAVRDHGLVVWGEVAPASLPGVQQGSWGLGCTGNRKDSPLHPGFTPHTALGATARLGTWPR